MLCASLIQTAYLVTIFCQNTTKCCHLRLRKYWLHNRANIEDIFGKDLKASKEKSIYSSVVKKKSQVKTCSEGRMREAILKS